jgi:hypothetical protein
MTRRARPAHRIRLAAIALAPCVALAWAVPAAALTQPDGTPIPQENDHPSLQETFNARGENINALAKAATTPETFVPGCALTFSVLLRNAGYKNSFGWYNVTGSKPDNSDLHEFLTCNDGVGTQKVLAIRTDPAYKGGEVGFYEATGSCATVQNHDHVFFSEKKYNPDGSQANPYIHLLIYDSTVTPKAFYFGWEDLLSGGDNDFDDLATFVTGITCSGGGARCDTGKLGVCADGTMQCQGGKLVCVQTVKPTPEKCDNFDNDCNGKTDDGDLCPPGKICDRGNCVPKCGSGEFVCQGNTVCNAKGLCVDPKCKTVDCPEGKKCVGGQCVGPCDGVVCPHGQVCRFGTCVDPCEGIKCDKDQVCEGGVCVDGCQCVGCKSGDKCQPDGHCVKPACVGKTCGPGTWCDADGTCKDSCAGAKCPGGGACVQGVCQTPGPDAGVDGGQAGGGGVVFSDGGFSGGGASGGTGGSPGSGGAVGGSVIVGPPAEEADGGCGCRAAGERRWSAAALATLASILLAARRRRLALGRRRLQGP